MHLRETLNRTQIQLGAMSLLSENVRAIEQGAIQSFATKSEPRAEASGQLAIAAKLRARGPADRDCSRNGKSNG